jgi:nickel/cobalt exporter
MIKTTLLLMLLFNLSYSCATCLLMVPSVELDLKLDIEKKTLKKIYFEWNFSDIYTEGIKEQYDKNQNNVFESSELELIREAMLEYLIPKDMLTSIEYTDDSTILSSLLKPEYVNYNLRIVDKLLVFSYEAKLRKELFYNSILSITCEDDESYFMFSMRELDVSENHFKHTENLYLFVASLLFQDNAVVEKIKEAKVSSQEKITKKAEGILKEKQAEIQVTEEAKVEEPSVTTQESYLLESMEKIKSLFESIKDEKNPMTYLFLLFFAYLYGVIHAMGPGHGKTLVASYFLANDRSYSKALFISLAIGIVHTFSAFILTVVIYYVLNTLLAQFLGNTVYYTTKISALIIIFIAIYLIYKKYRLYKQIEEEKNNPHFLFTTSQTHLSTCACSSCKIDKNSTDAALIISAGIIPCPGTTTLFIFAISTGLYYAGFISALVMSLGMSSVIFFSALFSTLIRKKLFTSSERIKKYLEFTSLILILTLGSFLLFV